MQWSVSWSCCVSREAVRLVRQLGGRTRLQSSTITHQHRAELFMLSLLFPEDFVNLLQHGKAQTGRYNQQVKHFCVSLKYLTFLCLDLHRLEFSGTQRKNVSDLNISVQYLKLHMNGLIDSLFYYKFTPSSAQGFSLYKTLVPDLNCSFVFSDQMLNSSPGAAAGMNLQ